MTRPDKYSHNEFQSQQKSQNSRLEEMPTHCSNCGTDLHIIQQEEDDKDPLKDELNDFEFEQYRRTVKSLRREGPFVVRYEQLFEKSPPHERGECSQIWLFIADQDDFEDELQELADANSRIFNTLNEFVDELLHLRNPALHQSVKRVKIFRSTYRLKAHTCSAFFDIVNHSKEKKLIFAKLKIRKDAYERAIKSINYCTNCGASILPTVPEYDRI